MIVVTPLGELRIRAEAGAIAEITFDALPDDDGDGGDDDALEREAAQQLRAYFAKERRTFDLPLRAEGTAFQQRVWTALVQIPYGATTSYGALAALLDEGPAGVGARAVGAANGSNPIAIVVPCHRVIGHNGALTGYGGGLWRKQWLLAHEGALLL